MNEIIAKLIELSHEIGREDRHLAILAEGNSPNAVLAGLLMANKAAAIFVSAAALGCPNFLSPKHVERIVVRPDEAYRQRQLKI